MELERMLGVKEYISELMQEGKIEDTPHLRCHPILNPIYVVEKTKKFFIAQQLVKNMLNGTNGFRVKNADLVSEFRLAYFPINIEHAIILSKSNVRPGGPQYNLPGSAAVL